MSKTIFIILLFISSITYGQKNIRFDNFVKLFPKITIPTCIKYSESEFHTKYYTPENTLQKESIPYHDHVLPKDSSLIIKHELVKSFLLTNTEDATLLNHTNKDPASYLIYPTYYITTQIIVNKNFVCLIYERRYNDDLNDYPYAEKYLCTITKTGKLIDKILVASANYSGTGILTESFRIPWFPDTQSNINNDLLISLKDGKNGNFTLYKIDDTGKINTKKAG